MSGNLQTIFNMIVGAVIAIIGGGGFIFGGYSLWDGFTNDQPEAKKKGATVLIITLVICIFMFAARSVIWGLISRNLPA